jgi:plastocyanin
MRIRDRSIGRRRARRDNPPAIIEALENRALLATVTVDVQNFFFSPASVTIHVGDTVQWVWDTPDHSTTSVKGSAISWDSGVLNTGATFDETFNQAGTFVYYCVIHGHDNGNGTASGMAGQVVVEAAGTPTPNTTPTPTPTPTASPLVATGVNGKAKVDKTFHHPVARFSEAGAQSTNFTVLIDWGDQSTPTFGQVRRMGKGRFRVLGSHRYLTTGVFQVMAMIQDKAGQEADAMSMVDVTGKVGRAHR